MAESLNPLSEVWYGRLKWGHFCNLCFCLGQCHAKSIGRIRHTMNFCMVMECLARIYKDSVFGSFNGVLVFN